MPWRHHVINKQWTSPLFVYHMMMSWTPFLADAILKCIFMAGIGRILLLVSPKLVPRGVIESGLALDSGFALNKCQAITCNNEDSVHWRVSQLTRLNSKLARMDQAKNVPYISQIAQSIAISQLSRDHIFAINPPILSSDIQFHF